MIVPGVIGHVAAEREATAWNGSGVPTAFTDRHYHYDPLGNTVLETGANATVLARTDMEAYGEMVRESNTAGTWAAGNGATNRPRQTTKETNPDTGLRWFGARWYDTGMGGWISPEPMRLDGPNLYWGNRSAPGRNYDSNGRSASPLAFESILEAVFYPLPPVCLNSISDQVNKEYDGGEGNDKFKHCLTMCRAMQECPGLAIFGRLSFYHLEAVGLLHELVGGWDSSDSPGDMAANTIGMNIGNCPGADCEKECAKYYPSKRLNVQ